jgi:hypothetical protein
MWTIQTLWLISTGEGNLWCKIREWYINYLKAQRFLGEFCKDKVLKEVKLVYKLLNFKHSRVYVP